MSKYDDIPDMRVPSEIILSLPDEEILKQIAHEEKMRKIDDLLLRKRPPVVSMDQSFEDSVRYGLGVMEMCDGKLFMRRLADIHA